MYLVTSYYRGALHIDPMRLVDTLEEAQAYAKTLTDTPRIYKLYRNNPPELQKVSK